MPQENRRILAALGVLTLLAPAGCADGRPRTLAPPSHDAGTAEPPPSDGGAYDASFGADAARDDAGLAPIDGSAPAGALVIEEVAGNGMALNEAFPSIAPLVVRVRDARGPREGIAVLWENLDGPTGAGGIHSMCNPGRTNAAGLAECRVIGGSITNGGSWSAFHTRASLETGASVAFVTTVVENGAGIPTPPAVHLLAPESRDVGRIPVGTVVPGALRMGVYAQSGPMAGQPIPDVALILTDASNQPATHVRCAPRGYALTGPDGIAVCDLEAVAPGGAFRANGGLAIYHDVWGEIGP